MLVLFCFMATMVVGFGPRFDIIIRNRINSKSRLFILSINFEMVELGEYFHQWDIRKAETSPERVY
jgi:hypothetical protein